MTLELQTTKNEKRSSELTITDIRKYICEKATDKEAMMFLQLCKSQNLDPWRKEAYLIKYDDTSKAQTVVGKDLFTKRAMQHPKFKGFKAGVILNRGGKIIEVDGSFKSQQDTLLGGWAEVFLKDYQAPIKSTVSLIEYNTGRSLWKKIPATMIRKVALVQALREAFPDELGGLYDESEMGVDIPNNNKIIEASIVEEPKAETKPQQSQAVIPQIKKNDVSKSQIETSTFVRCQKAFEEFGLIESQINLLNKAYDKNFDHLLEELKNRYDKDPLIRRQKIRELLEMKAVEVKVPDFNEDSSDQWSQTNI